MDVSRLTTADSIGDGRSSAVCDWDGDGRADILLKSRTAPRLRFYRNALEEAGNFLEVSLVGNGTTSNRDAIGATVRVRTADANLRQGLRAGEGFLAQSSKRLHFGLGSSTRVEELRVRWPDGTESVFEDLEANRFLEIRQGDSGAVSRILDLSSPSIKWHDLPEPEALPGRVRRVVLASELPMAPLPIPSFENPNRRVRDLPPAPVLLNLWREDCAPCIGELGEFAKSSARIEAMGLEIVPLTLDGASARESATAMLERIGVPTDASGYLDATATQLLLGGIYTEVHPPRSNVPFATPTSFLLDARGNLVVIYHGPVSLDVLEADVAALRSDDPRPVLDRLRHGVRLVHHKRDFEAIAEAFETIGESADAEASPLAEEADRIAAYYRRVDSKTEGYILRDGERRAIPDPKN